MKTKSVHKKTTSVKKKSRSKFSSMSFDDFVNTIGDDSSEQNSGSEADIGDIGSSRKKGAQNGQVRINGGNVDSSKSTGSDQESDEESECEDNEDGASCSEEEGGDGDGENADLELSANNESGGDDETSDEESDGKVDAGKKHKHDLNKLKDIDPEFYQYLQANDKKLLQFDVSDSDESDSGDGVLTKKASKSGTKSGSEEESDDAEDSNARPHGLVITSKMVKQWQANLATDKTLKTVYDVVQAFHAALQRISPQNEGGSQYKVVGGAVFNAIVRMCVVDLLPALIKFLKLPTKSLTHVVVQKSKTWAKARALVKSYLGDLLQLLDGVASVNVTTILLKHLHQMCPFVPIFPNIARKLLKKTISLWSSGEETVRVLAFMCALKVTTSKQETLLDPTLRYMYLAYISNTKFVSPTTLPGINFMRKSLAEMFLLDENVSYQHAFLYIRQLAIHLRNAINLQKKESIQAVYNWQFIASLALWVELLSSTSKPVLQPLLYPVVQVITGALKLVPTAQYFPLRFHCVRLLINVTRDCGTFVPTLPFLLEVLDSYDFNKKHTKVSMKPLDFTFILRVSKIQQQENSFKDAVIESIYSLLLQYSAAVSHSIAFPDLMVPVIVQLKSFLKKCKVPNYTKKMKQILDKIEANSKFIEKERSGIDINLSDVDAVKNWETSVKVKGTPLASFYSSWEKMTSLKESRQQAEEIRITEKGSKIKSNKNRKGVEGPTDQLPSDDSEPENDDECKPAKRLKHGQKVRKGAKKNKFDPSENEVGSDNSEEKEDVVEDAALVDW